MRTQYLPYEDIHLWMSFFNENAYKCTTHVDERRTLRARVYS